MHELLSNFITDRVRQAGTFVVAHMPIDLTIDQIYEDLINDPVMAQAFSTAAQYLPPSGYNSRKNILTEEWGALAVNLKLRPTDKYPVFLFSYAISQLTRQSRLSRALQLPVRVQNDWCMLHHTFNYFNEIGGDPKIMAFLFPWIRELIAEWKEGNVWPGKNAPKEVRKLDREVEAILDGRTPHSFPRMTPRLNEVCRSGKALFAQYRMLESSHVGKPTPPVSLAEATPTTPDWLDIEIFEAAQDWRKERVDELRRD